MSDDRSVCRRCKTTVDETTHICTAETISARTTVEEELLLSEPVANEYDSLTAIEEDLLLGAGDISRRPTSTDDTTTAFLLDSVENVPEEDSEQVPDFTKSNEKGEGIESEKEELDYEEDDDEGRRERTSRYTSEKKGAASRQNSEDGESSKKEKGAEKAKPPGTPSLSDKTINNNPMKTGDQPIRVILRIKGEAERIFYPPPAVMMKQQQAQPIVPRLPNGIPLVGMPSNHGRAGFGAGYQQHNQQQHHQGRLVGGEEPEQESNIDLMHVSSDEQPEDSGDEAETQRKIAEVHKNRFSPRRQ